jgi:hypothetical protein
MINLNDGSLLISLSGAILWILNPDDLKNQEINLIHKLKRSVMIPSAVFEIPEGPCGLEH